MTKFFSFMKKVSWITLVYVGFSVFWTGFMAYALITYFNGGFSKHPLSEGLDFTFIFLVPFVFYCDSINSIVCRNIWKEAPFPIEYILKILNIHTLLFFLFSIIFSGLICFCLMLLSTNIISATFGLVFIFLSIWLFVSESARKRNNLLETIRYKIKYSKYLYSGGKNE